MKSQRSRSKLFPRDLGAIFHERMMEGTTYEQRLHRDATPSQMVYTSTATLSTTIGTPLYVRRGGQIVGIRLGVTGAPSGTLTCDLLINGTSVFQTLSKPTIATSATSGHWVPVDHINFQEDDYLQLQLTDTGSATGPFTAIIEYLPGAF